MTPTAAPPQHKVQRKRLFDYPATYWATVTETNTVSALTEEAQMPVARAELERAKVSENSTCQTCSQTFSDFVLQRDHFRRDWHKFNLQRRVRGHEPLSEDAFDGLSDLGSIESLSGSETELSSEDDTTNGARVQPTGPTASLAEKIEFRDPHIDETSFLVVYRAALPDCSSLASLAQRGAWAVIMAGGGHFCAAIWDVNGTMVRHKTFHRYTSRRKQGGSQAAADQARGNANRIKSAGATLRRYGEQALQNEVHTLLKQWKEDLVAAQCVFVRASQREKKDLLVGWHGSPLKEVQDRDAVRNIPIPTRRATLKEAQRVYEELSTVRVSSVSLAESVEAKAKATKAKEAKAKAVPKPDPVAAPKKPTEKGTSHLKKRADNEKKESKHVHEEEEKVEEPEPETDPELAALLKLVIDGDGEAILEKLRSKEELSLAIFERHYLAEDKRFEKVDEAVGLIGVAAVYGHGELVVQLLDTGVSPAVGAPPYVIAKTKAMRVLLRKYWGAHPDRYDYAAAGIPSPLSEKELEEMAEREKLRRKREREKKKEKAREKAEAAKPPEVRAREQRAAAAEARMLGNRCAQCKKGLEGIVPFERLAYKYCSTACVSRHRQALNNM